MSVVEVGDIICSAILDNIQHVYFVKIKHRIKYIKHMYKMELKTINNYKLTVFV